MLMALDDILCDSHTTGFSIHADGASAHHTWSRANRLSAGRGFPSNSSLVSWPMDGRKLRSSLITLGLHTRTS